MKQGRKFAIGVMSGTSCDGVDALLLELTSPSRPHKPIVVARSHVPFVAELRSELVQPDKLSVKRLSELNFILPHYYIDAVKQLPGWQQAACVGVHGQTIWHQTGPLSQVRCTLQIGNSAVVAHGLKLPVVGDLRSADVANGGLGAPISPFAHWFFTAGEQVPAVVVNFGGICNLTYVTDSVADVVAYDVGPGMVLCDAHAVLTSKGKLSCDMDGVLSKTGTLIPQLQAEITGHPFIKRQPPKSTGREEFGAVFYKPLFKRFVGEHKAEDIAFTLVHATLTVLQEAIERDDNITTPLARLVLTGGGALNPTLQRLAKQMFEGTQVEVETEGVFAPANHEPAAMALIAARTMENLPSSLPKVTGAASPCVLGHIARPSH